MTHIYLGGGSNALDYEKPYMVLFNGITDAIDNIEHLNLGCAKDCLIKAQQEAEEEYIKAEEV